MSERTRVVWNDHEKRLIIAEVIRMLVAEGDPEDHRPDRIMAMVNLAQVNVLPRDRLRPHMAPSTTAHWLYEVLDKKFPKKAPSVSALLEDKGISVTTTVTMSQSVLTESIRNNPGIRTVIVDSFLASPYVKELANMIADQVVQEIEENVRQKLLSRNIVIASDVAVEAKPATLPGNVVASPAPASADVEEVKVPVVPPAAPEAPKQVEVVKPVVKQPPAIVKPKLPSVFIVGAPLTTFQAFFDYQQRVEKYLDIGMISTKEIAKHYDDFDRADLVIVLESHVNGQLQKIKSRCTKQFYSVKTGAAATDATNAIKFIESHFRSDLAPLYAATVDVNTNTAAATVNSSDRRKKVVIVGLLDNQFGIIRNEYGDRIQLVHIFKDNVHGYEVCRRADTTVIMCRFIPHSAQDQVKKHTKNITYVRGALDELRTVLDGLV